MRSVVLMLLITAGGCGNPFEFDPATTVILKVSGVGGEADRKILAEKAQELVMEKSTWHKTQTSEHAGTVMIKVSPVEDVQDYADRITFGRVTSIEGSTIHVEVSD